MNSKQLSIFDFEINNKYDCKNCMWMKAYGFCYPKEALGRQYFYESKAEMHCSDYGTQFAFITSKYTMI